MAGELERGAADRPAEAADAGEHTKAERQAASADHILTAADKLAVQHVEQDEAEITELAETKGISRQEATGQWLDKREAQAERSHQAYNLETSTSDLAHGPPGWMGGKEFTPEPQKQAFYAEARAKQQEALEYFREGPVEGPDNQPIDPDRIRPRLRWREGWTPPVDGGDLSQRDSVVYERVNRRDRENPRSGLAGPDAAPDPSLSAEQHQEKIDRMRGNAAEVMGAERWSNSKLAGQEYDLPAPLKERFPDGLQFSDEGFPIFDRYAAKTVEFAEGFRGPDRNDDFKRANEIFGWTKTPTGMRWHHKEDGVTMVLVDADLHAVGHWGGVRVAKQMGLWEGDTGK